MSASYAFFTRWCYLAGAVMSALVFFNARTILAFLYGLEYVIAARAVQAVAAVTLFGVIVGPNDGMLRALGSTRWISWTRLVAGIASLGTAFFLIPSLGLMGGVIAFIVSGVLINGLYAIYLFWQRGIHPFDRPYLKTLLVSFISFLLVGFVRPYWGDGLVGIGLSTTLYVLLLAGLLFALHAITPQDRQVLGEVYRQITSLV